MEQDLLQIVDMLLLNGTLTDCSGLIHGKMGIAVFFFHYAQHTGNDLFEDYALELIGEIQSQLHVNSPADYERGIAGIGVGIDNLIKNDFFEADDDFFDDFDQRMYRAVMYDPWQDFSLYDGLTGYGRYWVMRLRQQTSSVHARESLTRIARWIEEKLPDIPEREQADVFCFLHDLREISDCEFCGKLLEKYKEWDLLSTNENRYFTRLGNSVVSNIIRLYQRSRYFNEDLQSEIDIALKQIPDLDMEKTPVSMGLLTGYAGEGLLRLTVLHQTDLSWMELL